MKKWLLYLVLLAIVSVPLYAVVIWYWTAETNITNTPDLNEVGPFTGHMVATASENPALHVVYCKADPFLGRYLCYKRRIGTSWSAEKILVYPPYLSKEYQFSIAVDPTGTYVYVAYRDETYTPYCQINFIRSTDGGNSWEIYDEMLDSSYIQPIRISPWLSKYYYQPDIAAANDGKVFIVWQQGWLYGAHQIGFAHSDDYGRTWSYVEQIDSTTAGSKITPTIDCDITGNYAHIAWKDAFSSDSIRVTYRRYDITNEVFGPLKSACTRKISDNKTFDHPHIASSKDGTGTVHITWADCSYDTSVYTPDVYYVRSTDNGITWGTPKLLSGNIDNTYASRYPTISTGVTNSKYVDLVYFEYNTVESINKPYWRRSVDGGKTWGGITQITTIGENWGVFSATDYANTAHFLYSTDRNGYSDIYYRSYYSDKKVIIRSPGIVEDGTIAVGGIRVTPNPVVNEARISFGLSGNGNSPVIAKVYDIQGRFVRNLSVKKVDSGQASATWDCKNAAGRRVSSGVYLVSIQNNEQRETCRIVLSK